jgi:hypothetical protein
MGARGSVGLDVVSRDEMNRWVALDQLRAMDRERLVKKLGRATQGGRRTAASAGAPRRDVSAETLEHRRAECREREPQERMNHRIAGAEEH